MQENKSEDKNEVTPTTSIPKLQNLPARPEYQLDLATMGEGLTQPPDDCDADDEAESSNRGEQAQLETQPPSPSMLAHTQLYEDEPHSRLWHELVAAGKINPHDY